MALTLLKKELQGKITGAAAGSPELAKLEAELCDVQTKLSAGGTCWGCTTCHTTNANPSPTLTVTLPITLTLTLTPIQNLTPTLTLTQTQTPVLSLALTTQP